MNTTPENAEETPTGKGLASPHCSAPRFRINCRYCLAPLESSATFATKEEARAELKRWKQEATAQGQHIIGRIVEDE